MAVVKDGKVTVILGLIINTILVILKFVVFLFTHLNLFFADAIDSFVDGFVIFLLVVFLKFDLNKRLTYLNMDMVFFCQWSVILIFRIIIFLEQISDLIKPETREQPLLIIIVSSIVLVAAILFAVLFADEDDVVKFFVSETDKKLKKKEKDILRGTDNKKKKQKILPIFAEALDNLATTIASLIVGLLLYFNVIPDYVYLIDDISNMVISLAMVFIACHGVWSLAMKYNNKSYYEIIFWIPEKENIDTTKSDKDGNDITEDSSKPAKDDDIDKEESYSSSV